MSASPFNDTDHDRLRSRGIEPAEALRQLQLLSSPPRYSRLVRPATVGDGIVRVDDARRAAWKAAHGRAQDAGRFTKFVPASGAATRMFRELLYFHGGAGTGEPLPPSTDPRAEAGALRTLLAEIDRFAFHGALEAELSARGRSLAQLAVSGEYAPVLAALLDDDGLGYAGLPKALLLFHRDGDRPRTPFEEQLAEAEAYVRGGDGRCRLHFTVSPEHRRRFAELFASIGPAREASSGARHEVAYSVQKPSTDTLALDTDGNPARDPAGELLFRPAGHGALIENLAELDADLVFIKNIDNVQPDRSRAATLEWKRILGGCLVTLQEETSARLEALRAGRAGAEADAEAFVREHLGGEVPGDGGLPTREAWIERLDRPLRVCGVVPNTGEPGGGPFWVADGAGAATLQIVEGAQVDAGDPEQRAILGRSTHFNPVDLVCCLRDRGGRRYDLRRFVDADTAIVTRKSAAGRDLVALERPGLWNGAMARWNTVFVEVPIETFTPVKSFLDLLRPEHQPD